MPGIRLAYTINGRPPVFLEELVGKSQNIYAGDALALTTNSTYSINSVPAVRTLLAGDVSSNYGGGTVISPPAVASGSAQTTGGFIPSGKSYFFQLTYFSATGETTVSPNMGSAITTAGSGNASITITAPTPAANAVGYKIYATISGGAVGSTYYQVGQVYDFQNFTMQFDVSANAPNPPTVNTTGGIAGVLGVAQWSGITNTNGQWSGGLTVGGVQPGSVNYQFPAMGSGIPLDPNTNQSRITVYAAAQQNIFVCTLNSGSAPATPALNNTLAGLSLSGTNPTTFTILTTAPSAQQILRILRCDESDPLYGSVGGRVFFQFLESYDQGFLGRSYTGQ